MNTLREAVEEYLQLRRSLGFKLVQTQHWLDDFLSFMDEQQAPFITVELALRWAVQPLHAAASSYGAKRLMAIRRFARYRHTLDPRTEIPPKGLLPYRPKRAKPYPYTEGDISRLMEAAAALRQPNVFHGQSYRCLLGLLAVSGLRIGEALAFKSRDVNLRDGLLTIRGAKFGKSRLVPLHPSTQHALAAYAQQRDRQFTGTVSEHFFVSGYGRPFTGSAVRRAFRRLCRQLGLHGSQGSDEPQLHHLRHRFATETLLRWHRCGVDVEQRLPVLSTFLGHTCISDTYWYLSARPELMEQAVRRLARRWETSS